MYSRSSAGGSVLPSLDQPPPWLTKYVACAAPVDVFGVAKWYAPRMMPALYEPLYCYAKYGFLYVVLSVALM